MLKLVPGQVPERKSRERTLSTDGPVKSVRDDNEGDDNITASDTTARKRLMIQYYYRILTERHDEIEDLRIKYENLDDGNNNNNNNIKYYKINNNYIKV